METSPPTSASQPSGAADGDQAPLPLGASETETNSQQPSNIFTVPAVSIDSGSKRSNDEDDKNSHEDDSLMDDSVSADV